MNKQYKGMNMLRIRLKTAWWFLFEKEAVGGPELSSQQLYSSFSLYPPIIPDPGDLTPSSALYMHKYT